MVLLHGSAKDVPWGKCSLSVIPLCFIDEYLITLSASTTVKPVIFTAVILCGWVYVIFWHP